MALANYCLRGDLMDEMQLTDPNEEPRVDRAITDASRAIDAFCRQEPGAFAAQTLTKIFDVWPANNRSSQAYSYSPNWRTDLYGLLRRGGGVTCLSVPPLVSVTTLKTDSDGDGVYETTWTANTDYLLYPRNTEVKRRIDMNADSGRFGFPEGQARVQVAGAWGITEAGLTPFGIRRATLLLAMNYYRRPSSQLNSNGLGGAAIHFGYIDPDVASMLWSVAGRYLNQWVAA